MVECLARGAEGDRVAVDLEGALGVWVQPGDDFDQGGLAGAVVAQHAGHLAGVDLQVDPGQGDDRAEGLADVLHLHQRLTAVQGRVGVFCERVGHGSTPFRLIRRGAGAPHGVRGGRVVAGSVTAQRRVEA